MKKKIGVLLVLVFVIMQFFRPEKNELGYETIKSFEEDTKPSSEMKLVMQRLCYDCHSDQTQYPWYAEIAPASYWLADHVQEGKEHFNVSAWNTYTDKKKDHKLEELIEMIEEKEMPLASYTWIHGNLTESESKDIINWAKGLRSRYSISKKQDDQEDNGE